MIKKFMQKEKPAIGIFGASLCWYGAHELGFYFSALNCEHGWILPAVHLLALAGCMYCGLISYRYYTRRDEHHEKNSSFIAGISTMSAALFAVVIVWQGVATVIFNGCER